MRQERVEIKINEMNETSDLQENQTLRTVFSFN